MKIMDDISRVTSTKVRHRNTDLLIVVLQVDANILFQFLTTTQWCMNTCVLIQHVAVEEHIIWHLRERL